MKILYVLHQFFPNHHTGTERLTLQLAKQIQRMGNFVKILTYEPNRDVPEKFSPLEDQLLKREYQVETIPVICFKRKKYQGNLDVVDDSFEKYLEEIVKDFDIVHFTHPMHFGGVLKVCKKLKIPTILTLTDNWLLCPQGLLTIDHQLCDGPDEGKKCIDVCKHDKQILSRYTHAKFFFENVDRIFTGTEFVRKTFQENGWNKQVFLNTFSVDYNDIKSVKDPTSLVFGYLGSLVWHKGLHVLIDSFKKLSSKNIKLKIYGSGVPGDPYQDYVLNNAKEDQRIEYCGTFDYKDLAKVMADLSVIIIPSTYKEIFPLVMQLSFAYKKPIIATKIGGLPEVIKNNVNGLLFDIGNADDLARILNDLSENPEIILNLQNGIESPRRIEQEAFEYEKAYRQLLKL